MWNTAWVDHILQEVFKMFLLACLERSARLDQMKEVFLTLLDE